VTDTTWIGIVVGFVAGASAALLFLGRRLERERKNAHALKNAACASVYARRDSVRHAHESFAAFAHHVQREVGMLLRDPRAASTDPNQHLARASVAEAMAIAGLGEGRSLDDARDAIAQHLAALERLAEARGVKGVAERMAALQHANTIAQSAFERGSAAYARSADEIEELARALGVGAPPQADEAFTSEREGSLSYSA
jgi:hypothetical protein